MVRIAAQGRTSPPIAFREPSLVSEPSLDRINAAVRECLSRCFQAEDAVATIRNYIAQLRNQGWTEPEVALVRATVTRFLRQLAGELENGEAESEP